MPSFESWNTNLYKLVDELASYFDPRDFKIFAAITYM